MVDGSQNIGSQNIGSQNIGSHDVVVSVQRQDWADALADVPGLEPVVWDLSTAPPRDDIEVVVPAYMASAKRLERLADLPKLRAVQLVTAGFEHALRYLPRGVQLANGRGIHNASTAELAVGLALASQRGIDIAVRAQDRGEWLRMPGLPSLADRRVLILGYGEIGRAVAARLAPFETKLTAVASRRRAGDEFVSQIYALDDLGELLPTTEIVIVIVPLTDATRHLVDSAFLAQLPDGALMVNVARGGVVNTDALIKECDSGRLRAALDVTDPEPLPPDHPLWHTRGVIITPHVGGASTAFEPRAVQFLREQLGHFADTGELTHLVATGS